MAWNIVGDRPIYTQLIEQIEAKIITGEYPLGSRLASIRELATEASVNPNTMQRALTELERSGLVYAERTSGRYITDDATEIRRIKEITAKQQISEFLMKMRQLGFTKEEVELLIKQY